MKNRILIIALFFFVSMLSISFYFINKSYSYGLMFDIKGDIGSRKLIIYDADTETEISIDTAIKYYDLTEYFKMYDIDGNIYFYRGEEISEAKYIKGYASEQADRRAKMYGKSAYRVSTTKQYKNALDDIFLNHKIGEFYIEYSPYDEIDFDSVSKYYLENYGVTNPYQNYYTYKIKGEFEPRRFETELANAKENGEFLIDSSNIRISGNELKIVNSFINNILPLMKNNNSDYEKILAAYTYIMNTTTYIKDKGFINDALASNTSIYDVFINRKSVCIGYSIAFSYLMDLMGIESYIVDQITKVNQNTQEFESIHTYNIVKLDNKFYKVDITSRVFLSGINSNELYNKKLNISSSAYNTSGKKTDYYFDYKKIKTYLENVKKITTTTTTVAKTTTTTGKTTKITTNISNKENTKNTTKKNNTYYTTTYKNENNNNYNKTTTSNENYYTTSKTDIVSTNINKTNKNEDKENNNNVISNNNKTNNISNIESDDNNPNVDSKTSTNILLIGLGILVIVLYIVYSILHKRKKSRYDDDISSILNKHIR